jgi:molecular chaperone DnaK (HSP70)
MDNTQSASNHVYGIDLGTTYSCVAHIDEHGKPVVLPNLGNQVVTPSVVLIEDENIVVGDDAKNDFAREPGKVVSFIKRHIGCDKSFQTPTQFPVEKPFNKPEGYTPVEISALILKKLVQDANAIRADGSEIKDVVITCPAYFGDKERLQTKQAGEIAGLNVLKIINEPVAAAIAYGINVKQNKTILVYDLGGGTFDVTVIRVNDSAIRVIATGGDHRLGGLDWDTKIAEYLLKKFNEENNTKLTLESDPHLKNRLLLEAESRKKLLSQGKVAKCRVDYEGKSSTIELSLALFDSLTKDLLEKTIAKTRECLNIAEEKNCPKIDEVLLVGGSSMMPQVKRRIDKELNCDARLSDPSQCVAKGAAIFARDAAYERALEEYEHDESGYATRPLMQPPANRKRIVNVTSKTYGTDVVNALTEEKIVYNMIFANTPLPVSFSHRFSLRYDNQTNVSLGVFESDVTDDVFEREIDFDDARLLDKSSLKLTKKWPKGTDVMVTFTIDDEGILSVHGDVKGETIDFTVKITGVLSQDEVETAREELDCLNIE